MGPTRAPLCADGQRLARRPRRRPADDPPTSNTGATGALRRPNSRDRGGQPQRRILAAGYSEENSTVHQAHDLARSDEPSTTENTTAATVIDDLTLSVDPVREATAPLKPPDNQSRVPHLTQLDYAAPCRKGEGR
ncbi:hypothetical protein [Streptomyces griseomycini]|uniref:Uncharacterized protein n=1 Tax=Streptomyces griseomycini TaxID=66895 RepID=A0A7W7PXR6_9ACTN|nr:hypothetical protein [Streptomyces griseomycini]MBB4903291.1 hypothetical protein [Streptomyces griseomycini]GGR43720.1 hypothetical protein GCM10015536_57100 [Streptomyces griseomycini]